MALSFENVDHAWRDWPRARPADGFETTSKVYVDIDGLTRDADLLRLRVGRMPFATSCMILVSRLFERHRLSLYSSTLGGGDPLCLEESRGVLFKVKFEIAPSGEWTKSQLMIYRSATA
jgi:hypothetical protein